MIRDSERCTETHELPGSAAAYGPLRCILSDEHNGLHIDVFGHEWAMSYEQR